MVRCPRCRDPRSGRHYISRSRYRCTGEMVVWVSADGMQQAFDPCDAVYVDEHEAAAEAAEKRAQRQAREIAAAVRAGTTTGQYCECGTLAIRRCTRCREPVCNDEGVCSFKPDGNWLCESCSRHFWVEKRKSAEDERLRRARAYDALPLVTVDEMVAYLEGDRGAIEDGARHRVRGVNGRMVADAFAKKHGRPVAMVVEDHYGMSQTVLEVDGSTSLHESVTKYGKGRWGAPGYYRIEEKTRKTEPDDSFFPKRRVDILRSMKEADHSSYTAPWRPSSTTKKRGWSGHELRKKAEQVYAYAVFGTILATFVAILLFAHHMRTMLHNG